MPTTTADDRLSHAHVLERILQRQLDNTRADGRGADLAEVSSTCHRRRVTELRVVPNIEELSPELNGLTLSDGCDFCQRDVPVVLARPKDGAAPHITETRTVADCGNGAENTLRFPIQIAGSARDQPVAYALRQAARGQEVAVRHSRADLSGGIGALAAEKDRAAGAIGDGQRCSVLYRGDTRSTPALGHPAEPSLRTRKRQVPDIVQNKSLGPIIVIGFVCDGLVRRRIGKEWQSDEGSAPSVRTLELQPV